MAVTTTQLIIETAFRLHKEGILSRANFVDILQTLVNAVARDNGYAEKYGLPFPARPLHQARGRHVP